jgi:hypothetical protein
VANHHEFGSVPENIRDSQRSFQWLYPTISLVLLFRAEIVAAIADLAPDCEMVSSMKQGMRQALNPRLPITELIVTAAMLDPSQRHLNYVQEFPTAQKITAVELPLHAFDKYVGTESELGQHQAGQQMASLEIPGPNNEYSRPVPWKKAKRDLHSKHVNKCYIKSGSRNSTI